MPRYIDADALKAKYEQMLPEIGDGYHKETLQDVLFELEYAPTIYPDEVRGVVHCKECKWCHAGYCEKYDDIIPWGCANKPWEDWFCADGKRREIIKEAQDAD